MLKKLGIILLLGIATHTTQASNPPSAPNPTDYVVFQFADKAIDGACQVGATAADFIREHPTAAGVFGLALTLYGSYLTLKTVMKNVPKFLLSAGLIGTGAALLIIASDSPQ